MIGCSNFLLISRIVTRRIERRWCISIITVTWEMGNANQMVSSESCLAPAALPRDHRSEFGSLSHPWYSMGICSWHPWTVVRALGTTSQPPVGLQSAWVSGSTQFLPEAHRFLIPRSCEFSFEEMRNFGCLPPPHRSWERTVSAAETSFYLSSPRCPPLTLLFTMFQVGIRILHEAVSTQNPTQEVGQNVSLPLAFSSARIRLSTLKTASTCLVWPSILPSL